MHLKQPIYLLLLIIAFLASLNSWKLLTRSDRVISVLLGITILQEAIAYLCTIFLGDNLFTYHVYSPLEFFLICLYFNYANKFLRKYNAGVSIGVIGVATGIVDTLFFQPLTSFNSYYLLFEGTIIILLCLFSLCEILLADLLQFGKSSYFWITLCIMLYWSVTYTGWGIFNLVGVKNIHLAKPMVLILYVTNLLFYLGLAIIFFNYKKLNRSDAQ